MWLLDEGKGAVAKDSSENGNDGEVFDAQWGKGKLGTALSFDGKSSYVNCGNDTSLDITSALTIVAWIKEEGEQTGWPRVVARENPGKGHRQYAMCYSDKQEIRAIADTEGDGFCDIIGGELNNDWHHIAMTYSNGVMELFVDGASKGTAKGKGKLVSEGEDANVAIGKTSHAAQKDFFLGSIDEVAIFNVALTKDNIKAIMTKGLLGGLSVGQMGKLTTTWSSIKSE